MPKSQMAAIYYVIDDVYAVGNYLKMKDRHGIKCPAVGALPPPLSDIHSIFWVATQSTGIAGMQSWLAGCNRPQYTGNIPRFIASPRSHKSVEVESGMTTFHLKKNGNDDSYSLFRMS